MSYGFELRNTNDEIILSTDQPYPLLVPTTPSSTSAYGSDVPIITTSQVLLARPQNGESGVITTVTRLVFVGGNQTQSYEFFGTNGEEQYWGAAPGVKTLKCNTVANTITSPTTDGSYGFECYDTSGNVLFSTALSDIIKIEAVIQLGFGQSFYYDNPSGAGNFDDLYVMVQPLAAIGDAGNMFANMFDDDAPDLISGFYAYFDDSIERIHFIASGSANTTSSSGPTWETIANTRNTGTFVFGYTTENPYLAVVARKI